MSANTPGVTPGATPSQDADDNRRMAPVYLAVIVVEVITLLAVWWFQASFS